MTTKEIEKLLELITMAVQGSGSYQEKRQRILDEIDNFDKIMLEEFASWFVPEEKST